MNPRLPALGGEPGIDSGDLLLMRRLAAGGPGGNVVASTFVWKPGGVAGGNVFTTLASLMAAAASSPGPKFMELDSSAPGFVSFIADVGTWNFDQFTINPGVDTTADSNRRIIFPTGSFFTSNELFCRGGTLLQSENATGPVYTVGSGGFGYISFEAGGITTNAAGVPFVDVQSGGALAIRALFNAQFQPQSGQPIFKCDTGGVTTIRCLGGLSGGSYNISPSALTGGGTFNVHASAEALVSTSQPGVTGTFNFIWDPLVNEIQSSTAVGSGTHTVASTTAAIARLKSGKVQVLASCSGATAAADTITVAIVRDLAGTPVTVATQTVVTTAGQLNYNVSLAWIDTLPDNAAHTYSIQLSGSQNNTVAANQALVMANEL
jgi:hypothetical protein